MLQQWSTKDIEVQDRYPAITDAISSALCQCDVSSDAPLDHFDARIEHVDLGDISLLRYASFGTQAAKRTMQHVRADGGDSTLLYLPITADLSVSQGGQEVRMAPGKASLVPLNKPLVGHFIADSHKVGTAIQARIPTELLQRSEPRIAHIFNQPLSLKPGSGRLMLTVLQSVFEEAQYMNPQAAQPVSRTIVDAICSLAAEAIQENPPLLEHRNNNALNRVRIVAYIERHLPSPDLNPRSIAEGCNMSARCVHRAFENEELSVAAYIREQRLLHCRRDLQDLRLQKLTVSEIAYRWGFNDVSHFSRAYKTRFKISPKEDRPH